MGAATGLYCTEQIKDLLQVGGIARLGFGSMTVVCNRRLGAGSNPVRHQRHFDRGAVSVFLRQLPIKVGMPVVASTTSLPTGYPSALNISTLSSPANCYVYGRLLQVTGV
jgi:hypothetical protein